LSFAVAGLFNLSIYTINLRSPLINEESLEVLFVTLPGRCLVLLEDIDTAGITNNRRSDESSKASDEGLFSDVSLSALLNVIDGVAAQEGRVMVMTTNHVEKLDEALIRAGRVDLTIKFELANATVIAALFHSFFTVAQSPSSDSGLGKMPKAHRVDEELRTLQDEIRKTAKPSALAFAFTQIIPEGEFSLAEIQGYLLGHRGEPMDAINNAADWVMMMRNRNGS
jgi:chaperone BCS1